MVTNNYIVDENTGCWDFQGGLTANGYGPYRKMYIKYKGEVPDGLELDHLCRNRKCINPDHLEPVTRSENFRRGDHFTARVMRSKKCVHGHALEGDNVVITSQGKTRCQTCHKLRMARYRKEGKLKWDRGGALARDRSSIPKSKIWTKSTERCDSITARNKNISS